MFNFKEQPYKLLLLSAIALSFLLTVLQIAGIEFQDMTMFLIPLVIIMWTIPVTLIFFWLLYSLTKRLLYSKAITWTHIIITIVTAVFIVTVLYHGINPMQPIGRRYYDTSVTDNQRLIGKTVQVVFITLICGQCSFIANVLLGLFVSIRRKINGR
jgi:hypothetical protein